MLSAIYYIFLTLLCTLFLLLSAVALVICLPFDPGRRVVHELSRILVRIFYAIPPFWRQKVVGLEHVDRSKSYVIVINHNAMVDIPSLYYLPLNFRWVSKREVFRIPFFGQFLSLHGDICIDRAHAKEAMEQLLSKGRMWFGRGASVAIFPEGTRSKTGEIGRFKAGAFALAKSSEVEILPVVMEGTRTLVKDNRLFNWGNRIDIRILEPVLVEDVRRMDVQELMESVRDRMCVAQREIRAARQ